MAVMEQAKGVGSRGRRIREVPNRDRLRQPDWNPFQIGSRAAVMFEALVRAKDAAGQPKKDSLDGLLGVGEATLEQIIDWIMVKAKRRGNTDDRGAALRDVRNRISDALKDPKSEDNPPKYRLRMKRKAPKDLAVDAAGRPAGPEESMRVVYTVTHVRNEEGDWVTLNRWLKQHGYAE